MEQLDTRYRELRKDGRKSILIGLILMASSIIITFLVNLLLSSVGIGFTIASVGAFSSGFILFVSGLFSQFRWTKIGHRIKSFYNKIVWGEEDKEIEEYNMSARLSICRSCMNHKYNLNSGVYCGLTGDKPIFKTRCESYEHVKDIADE